MSKSDRPSRVIKPSVVNAIAAATAYVVQPLERRLLLATDLTYNAGSSTFGLTTLLRSSGTQVQLVRAADNSVLAGVALSDFSGNVGIKFGGGADTLTFDPSLAGVATRAVTVDGGNGTDAVNFAGDLNTGGSDLIVDAETIVVGINRATISTRVPVTGGSSGNSGNITLRGQTIDVRTGSKLLAGADNGFSGGDITLKVTHAPTLAESIAGYASPLILNDRQANITIGATTIDGRTVVIDASAATKTSWNDAPTLADDIADSVIQSIGQLSTIAISAVAGISGQVKIQKATGNIVVTDAQISATGAVSVNAAGSADASFTAVAINSAVPIKTDPTKPATNSPFLASIGYGETLAKANVELAGSTTIVAGGDVTVGTTVESAAKLKSRGVGNGALSNSDAVDVAVALGIALTTEESTVTTGANTSIVSARGNVDVKAGGEADTETEAASLLFRDGVAGLAVGVSVDKATINSTVNGKITAANPQGTAGLGFDGRNGVSGTDHTITIGGIGVTSPIQRGDGFTYDSRSQPAVVGLVDGEKYVVADATVVGTDVITGTITQRITLAKAATLDLDATQTSAASSQTLGKYVISTFNSAAVTAGASNVLTIDPAALTTALSSGQSVQYTGPNSPVSEKNITATFARLASGDTITRTDGGADWQDLGLHVGEQIQLGNGVSGVFTIKSFSTNGRVLVLNQANTVPAGTVSGFSLTSLPLTPTGIGNLIQGANYTVAVVNGRIQLRDPTNGNAFVQFNGAGVGIQGFLAVVGAKNFFPVAAVNNDRDTITIANHGFVTGDLLNYQTDPTKSTTKPVYGYDPTNPNTPVLIGQADLPDAPIDGLQDGEAYYVTVVDANTIRLSESSVAARDAVAIPIAPAAGTGAQALVAPEVGRGVNVTANFEATNGATAGVELSDGEQPLVDLVADSTTNVENLLGGFVQAPDLLASFRSAFQSKVATTPPTPPGGTPTPTPPQDSGVPLELSGTFAVNIYQHDVNAVIGSTAVIKTGGDLTVDASVEESTATASTSEATRDGLDAADASSGGSSPPPLNATPREDVEISVGFGYASNKNYAHAIVSPSAVTDASGQTTVHAHVDYPIRNGSAENAINPIEMVKNEGLDGLNVLLDGTLGVASNLFNGFVTAVGGDPGANDADKFVVGAAVLIQLYDNESYARIDGGALVNQDAAYRNAAQGVDVNAETTGTLIDVGQISSLNLSVPGIIESGTGVFETGNLKGGLLSVANPFGVSGQNAIGPSVLVSVMTNDTLAEVQSDARVYVGSGGLNVSATQDILNVAVSQTGARASDIGITASVTVGYIESSTIAHIGSTAQITGTGDVTVNAGDTVNRYGIDGGFISGEKIGIGAAVGVNTLIRTTLAYIGSDTPDADATNNTAVNVGGDVSVTAGTHGKIFALGIAGTALTDPDTKPTPTTKTVPVNPNPPTVGQGSSGGLKLAVGASVEVNTGTANTRAFIDDPNVTAGGGVDVTALNDVAVTAIVVGGAIALVGLSGSSSPSGKAQGGLNVGIGGAFAVNRLTSPTDAFIRDSSISAGTGGVTVRATNQQSITADGGGVSVIVSNGTNNQTNLSLGVGVGINEITAPTNAFLDAATVNSGGDVTINAVFTPTINVLAIGGAGAVSTGSTQTAVTIAGAAGAAKNVITGGGQAYAVDSSLRATGTLSVLATDTSVIKADVGAGALAISVASGNGTAVNIAVGISVGLNEITSTTRAYLLNSTADTDGDLKVIASSGATINVITIAGTLAAGGSGASLSGAGSGNTIKNTVEAYVQGGVAPGGATAAVVADGATTVSATNTSTVTADGGGFALALAISTRSGKAAGTISAGIGAAVNDVTNVTNAYLRDTTLDTRSLSLRADATATIKALTMAGAGAATISSGSAFNFAGAGAGSGNKIAASTIAKIEETSAGSPTSVRARNGGVSVQAVDTSSITANAGGIAIALGLSNASSGNAINVSVGVSAAVNNVGQTVYADVLGSTINATGAMAVGSTSGGTIQALTIAGAAAGGFATSGNGISLAGAGTGSGNTITVGNHARANTSAITLGGAFSLTANDTATIRAQAYAGALSLTAGTGGSVSVGAAIAINKITPSVTQAIASGSTINAAGNLQIAATSTGTIDATTVGVAAAVQAATNGGTSVAGAGAGAQSTNTIRKTVEAYANLGSKLTTTGGGNVAIGTIDNNTIKADAGGGSLAVSGSTQGLALAAAISAGLAYNDIADTVRAFVDGSGTTVNSAGNVDITTLESSGITALAVSVSAAVAVANPMDGIGVALSGGGAESNNTITNKIAAFVANAASVTAANSVAVRADDKATINTTVPAVSVNVSIGAGLAIGVTLGKNVVTDTLEAYVAASTVKANNGGVAVDAGSETSVEGSIAPVAVTASIGLSGQGGRTDNTIGGSVDAGLRSGSTVSATGNVDVTGYSTATAKATANTGGGGVVNIGGVLANAAVDQTVRAGVDNAAVTAGGLRVVTYGLQSGDPTLSSRTATSQIVAGQIGIVGGTGANADAKVTGTVDATVALTSRINVTGAMNVEAKSKSVATADTRGGSGGAVNVAAMLANAANTGATRATIGNGGTTGSINAGSLNVLADADKTTGANILAVAVTVAGGAGGKATTLDSAETGAGIGSAPSSQPNVVVTGAMNVQANSNEADTATASGGTGGVLNAAVFLSNAQSTGNTRATLADSANVSADSLIVRATTPARTVTATENNAAAKISGSVSAIGGLGVQADALVTGDTAASIGKNARVVTPTSGSVLVESTGITVITTHGEAGSGGVLNATKFEAKSQAGTSTDRLVNSATIGDGSTITTGNLAVNATNSATVSNELLAVTVGAALGVSTANSQSDSYADAIAALGTGGAAVTVNAGGDVSVTAANGQSTNAKLTSGAGGVASGIGTAYSVANTLGNASATVGDKSKITSGEDVVVKAESLGATSNSNLVAGSGGAISVGTTTVDAVSRPTINAATGLTVAVQAAGDLTVQAIGRSESDAYAQSSGGGGVQVGVAYARTTNDPTVNATVGAGDTLTTGDDLTVDAKLLKIPAVTPPTDQIIDGDDADTVAVDTANDTADFTYPVSTGDTVVYQAPSSSAVIGGLTNGRAYNVIVTTAGRKIQFGNQFNGATGADALADTITFAQPHNFKAGDAVRLNNNGGTSVVEPYQTGLPGVLYVRPVYTNPDDPTSIDPFSIRLVKTQAEATASEPSLLKSAPAANISATTNRITIAGNGFVSGQAVTYRAPATQQFLTEAADVTVAPRVITGPGGTTQTINDIKRDANGGGLHTDNNNIFLPNHGFGTGDAVTYRTTSTPIGGLTNGQTYYVIKIDANQVKLAGSYREAVGQAADNRGTPSTADDIPAIALTPINLMPAGSQAGQHTLSRDLAGLVDGRTYYVVNPSGDSFQLSAARGGAPIAARAVDTINVLQNDGTVARTITPVTRGGNHRFGTLGLDLRAGTGTQSVVIDLTGNASGVQRLLDASGQPLSLVKPPPADGVSSAQAYGGSGGGIDVSVPSALMNSKATVLAQFNAATTTVTGDVAINATGATGSGATADTTSGGVVGSVGEAHAFTNVTTDTRARIGDLTSITAGSFLMNSGGDHAVSASATSKGGGFVSGRIARTQAKLTDVTVSQVGGTVTINSAGLLKIASDINADGRTAANTESYGAGAGADSDRFNDNRGVTINTNGRTIIGANAVLSGVSVDLSSTVGRIYANAFAGSVAGALFPVPIATAGADVSAVAGVDLVRGNGPGASRRTQITGTNGVDIQSFTRIPEVVIRYAREDANGVIYDGENSGGTYVNATVNAAPDVLVVAGARDAANTPLQTRSIIPQLSLFVRGEDKVAWDADVTIRAANPEVVVDANGNIVSARNASVTQSGGNVVVGDLVGGAGQVGFEGDGEVGGAQGLFTFNQSFDAVTIRTAKGGVVVGNIQPYGGPAGVEPKVTIDAPTSNIEFDVTNNFAAVVPTITIQSTDPNAAAAGIRLDGVIDNPVGTVKISTAGTISATDFAARRGVVRANRVEMTSTGGSIGGLAGNNTTRIGVDVVTAQGRPSPTIRTTAAADINVALQALLRDPTYPTNIPLNIAGGTIGIDSLLFDADRAADIMLLGGLDQRTTTGTTPFGIQVFETARNKTPGGPRTTFVTNHFRISTGNTTTSTNVGIYGTGTNPYDVTWNLGNVYANTSIDAYKADSVTSRNNIVSSVDIADTSSARNVDVRTNGFINATESNGDLRVGRIASSDDDVTLSSRTGNIVDIGDDNSTAGDAAADAIGAQLVFNADNGAIGTVANPLDIDSATSKAGNVFAYTSGDINLYETATANSAIDAGNMSIFNIRSKTGNASLRVATGGVVDANDSGISTGPNVTANRITFTTDSTSPTHAAVGTATNPLEIDSSFSGSGGLVVKSAGVLNVLEVANELNLLDVGNNGTGAPNLTAGTLDTAGSREDVIVNGPISVSALTVKAGDDFDLPFGKSITATGPVSIQIDRPDLDKDSFGASLAVSGNIVGATKVELLGGKNIDRFNVRTLALPAGATYTLDGNAPSYPTFPGDQLTVNGNSLIQNQVIVDSVTEGRGRVVPQSGTTLNFTNIEQTDNSTVNDPPINVLPANFRTSQNPITLSGSTGNAIQVTDIDSNDDAGFTVDLTPSANVTLALVGPTDGVTVSAFGQATRLRGLLANINAALANGLRVTAPTGYVGPVTIQVVSQDSFGGKDTDTLTITIDNVINDPPVNSLPAGPIDVSTKPLLLSAITRNALSVTDVDAGNATNFSVTLSNVDGTIVVAPRTGVTVTGSGTGSVRLVGTFANINLALAAGVSYTPNDGFSGTTYLQMLSDDAGNTGTGGVKTDTDLLELDVADFNIAPVNHVPPTQTVLNGGRLILSAATGNAISVTDADNENGPYFDVELTLVTTTGVFAGTLELLDPNSPVGLTDLRSTGSNFHEYDLFGTLEEINATLAAGIVYTSSTVDPEFEGIENLYVDSNDQGSTGLPGPLTDRDIIDINVTRPPNQPPVNTVPADVLTESATTVFSTRNGNALKVDDPDFRLSGINRIDRFTVQLSTTVGSLRLIDSGTLRNLIGDGTPQYPLTLEGTIDGINAALASGVVFNTTPGTNVAATITMLSNDAGGYGGGGEKTDTDSFIVRYFTDLNDAPINTVPSDLNTTQQVITFSDANGNPLGVFDEDAGLGTVETQLFAYRVTNEGNVPKLTVMTVPGVTILRNGTDNVTLRGPVGSINAALRAGVTMEANSAVSPLAGQYAVTIFTNDNGNSGPGGPKSDFDLFRVTIAPGVNSPPVNHLPDPIFTDATTLVFSDANGNALSASDIDFPVAANDFTVKLTTDVGTLKLLTASGITAVGDGTAAAPLTLAGGIEQINAALAYGLQLVTPTAFTGVATLTMVSNDAGRTGTGGVLTDTDTLPITITNPGPVNDPPVNHLPDVVGVTSANFYDFNAANGSQLSITDPDAGNASNFRLTLSVTTGGLQLFGSGGTTSNTGTTYTITAPLATINARLALGVRYTYSSNSGGESSISPVLVMESNDNGNTGSGGAKGDVDVVRIVNGAVGGNTPPMNLPPAAQTTTAASVVLSQANGNALSFLDNGNATATNYSVTLSIPDGVVSVEGTPLAAVTGGGTLNSPLVLTGTRANINATLAAGIRVTPLTGYLGTTLLKMASNDAGNTGTPLVAYTDTDYLPITFNRDLSANVPPKIVGVIADSSNWAAYFRDYVDNGFADPSALGYRIPNGTQQDRTLPWVNVDRLKIQFSEDVGPSLALNDFSFAIAAGVTALGAVKGTMPTLAGYSYDRDTYTATLLFDGPLPTSVIDLKVAAAGVTDVDGATLDGEWTNNVTTPASGDGVAGGDFDYRIFVLPGDAVDGSVTGGVRNVNAVDAQRVRDRQNGIINPAYGALNYDLRSDLDGDGFINAIDARYSRDQQNAIIVPQATRPPASPTGGIKPAPTDDTASALVDSTATPVDPD